MKFGTRGALARRDRRRRRSRGAVLVEFALVAPLLFALIFGTIEFGWAFYQQMNVRHGAREGIRLAAVNAAPANSQPTQGENLAKEVCLRMDAPAGTLVSIALAGTEIGGEVTVTIEKPLDQLTGVMGPFLDDIELHSTVATRLEQAADYSDVTDFPC